MTNPPTPITTSSMTTSEGSASIADAAGNLLFYTDGSTVYDRFNNVMGNGTGLLGYSSSSQSAVICRLPGSSTIYYIFTQGGSLYGLNYSIVDMTLASGNGSVTVKNSLLLVQASEKLTSARHCNGVDTWIVTHSYLNDVFYSYLLTSSGLNVTPVTSTIGPVYSGTDYVGIIKLSPNGQKLAESVYGPTAGYELYDFDASTGLISNNLFLGSGFGSAYGVEFSPDGSKLYGARFGQQHLYQWDLCAGSPTAIVSSFFQLTSTGSGKGQLQLANNGKIYFARQVAPMLGVINNPNLAGAACNFTETGQALLGTGNNFWSTLGMPNFITSSFKPPTAPFTYTVNYPTLGCLTASFTASPPPSATSSLCAFSGYSVNALSWNFGDPGTGSANTSTLISPAHVFSSTGTYTVKLIVYYSCGGGIDTVQQVLNMNQPCVVITSSAITCASLGSATVTPVVGTGPFTYTWLPGGQTTSVVTGLAPSTYSAYAFDAGNGMTYSITATIVSPVPFVGIVNNTYSLNCPGATTGTAAIQLFGGSGNQSYAWTNATTTLTTPTASNLSAGLYNVFVTDALTSCTISQGFFILQPPAFNLNVSVSSPTVCAGKTVTFSALNSGGNPVPGYSYTWTSGPQTNTWSVNQPIAGNFIYTVMSSDGSNCLVSNTVALVVTPIPSVSVVGAFICPGQTGTLSATGANNYTWNSVYSGPTFTDNPIATTQYSVLGSALGCTAAAQGNIFLKPVPVPTISPATAVCESSTYLFSASGGTGFVWTGPQGFNSSLQNNSISTILLNQAGVYQVTVTAANNCTASAFTTLTVNPLPQVSITPISSSVCISTGSINLTALGTATQFTWSPTLSVSNPTLPNITALTTVTTIYTVTGELNGCISSATATVTIFQPPPLTAVVSANSVCVMPYNISSNNFLFTAGGATTYTILNPPLTTNANPSGPSSQIVILPSWSQTGLVTTTVIGSNGVCTATAAASVSVIVNPVVSITSPTAEICTGESFTFSATNADSYFWSSQNPAIPFVQNDNAITISPTVSSVFSVFGFGNGCYSSPQSCTLTVKPLPQISINAVTVCVGSTVALTAQSNATSFLWTPSSFLNNTNSATVVANPPTTQNYQILATLNSCTRSAATTVSVIPLPTAAITTTTTSLCVGERFTFFGNGGGAYLWNGPNGFTSSAKDIFLIGNSVSSGGIYTLTVSNDALCKNSATQEIIVYDLPKGALSSLAMEGCVPFCSDLRFVPVAQSAPITSMNWIFGNQTYTGTTFNLCFDLPGSYTVTGLLTNSNNCSNTLRALIHAWPIPKADFSYVPEHPLQMFEEVLFTSTSVGAPLTWFWKFVSNDGFQSTQQHPAYAFPDAGTFPVALVVKNQWGCSDTAVKTITVLEDLTVYVPEAFTPNADGLNDIFIPKGTGLKNYTLSVFNRWGQLMFISKEGQKMGWDGTYKGEPAKNDVYTWTIELLGTREQVKTLSGVVTLYR